MRWAIVAAALGAAALVLFYVSTGVDPVLSSVSATPHGPAAVGSLRIAVPRPAVRSGRSPVAPLKTDDGAPAVGPSLVAASPVSAIGDRPLGAAATGRILRRQVMKGLSEFRPRLASCPDSREGRLGKKPAVLILELLSRDGGMEIVHVLREKHGAATDSFMACARDVLRGRLIPIQDAKSGTRMHLAFHLTAQ